MNSEIPPASTIARSRLLWLDAARGVALVTMASFHLTWDLDYFGYLEHGTANSTPLRIYAHAIAGSFLFLAGASLYLAHGQGVKWNSFWRRFVKILVAAGLVTAATLAVMPREFIYFGILHNIAAASLVGLLFLRVPSLASLALAALLLAAPYYLRDPFFNTPALYWVGLSQWVRPSNDYVPLIPWFGPFLAGLAVLKLLVSRNWTDWLSGARAQSFRLFKWLLWAGRHSLVIYLVHQPILIGFVWCFSQILPPSSPDPALSYIQSCKSSCVAQQNETFCASFCGCTLDVLKARNLFDDLRSGELNVNNDKRVTDISRQCTMSAQEAGQQSHE